MNDFVNALMKTNVHPTRKHEITLNMPRSNKKGCEDSVSVIRCKWEKTDGGAKLVFTQSWCCVPSVENKMAPSDYRG